MKNIGFILWTRSIVDRCNYLIHYTLIDKKKGLNGHTQKV